MSKTISVHFSTEEEKNMVDRWAKGKYFKVSALIRKLILEEINKENTSDRDSN